MLGGTNKGGTMTIITKKVTGRRSVRYESLDDLLSEAEQLAEISDLQMLGNWSLGQIYAHLAKTMNDSIDGMSFSMPAPIRWVMSLLMKKKLLTQTLPAGFKTSSDYIPGETETQVGLEAIRSAISRQKNEPNRVPHPGFGKISTDEWIQFHLRHAEMHLSFAKPRLGAQVAVE